MRTKITSILIAIAVAGLLLYVMLQPSAFNYIPYLIHKAVFEEVNSKGEIISAISEESFIMFFDSIVACLIFWIVYKLSNKFLRPLLN